MQIDDYRRSKKVLVQGITRPLASYWATQMQTYGTAIVAGVCPGSGGQQVQGIPVYDLVEQAQVQVGEIDISLIFTEPYGVLDAATEAIACGIRHLLLVSRGVPPLDMVRLLRKAQITNTLILGPGSAGILIPEAQMLGTYNPRFYCPGSVGLISRTNALSAEIAAALTQANLGQSVVISLGNEPMNGSDYPLWLEALESDPKTEAIVLVGQVGIGDEQAAAEWIAARLTKPVIAYIAGAYAPIPPKLGKLASLAAAEISLPLAHAGTAEQKIAALESAKVAIAQRPSQIPHLVGKALKRKSRSKRVGEKKQQTDQENE